MNDKTIKLLRFNEGFKSKPYLDTEGFSTVGIGRCIDKSPLTKQEQIELLNENGISEKLSEQWAKRRLEQNEKQLMVRFAVWSSLDEVRKAALLDMSYQLGVDGLLEFTTTLGHIEHRQYEDAAKQALKSKWAKQTPNRAKRIAEMILTGQWPKEIDV